MKKQMTPARQAERLRVFGFVKAHIQVAHNWPSAQACAAALGLPRETVYWHFSELDGAAGLKRWPAADQGPGVSYRSRRKQLVADGLPIPVDTEMREARL